MTSPTLTVTVSSTDLLRIAAKFGLSARELSKSAARAVNDVARTGRGQTRKAVRAVVALPASRVNSAIQIETRATPDRLQATLTIDAKAKGQDRRPTLMSFKGKPKKPEHTYKSWQKRREMGAAQRRRRKALKRKAFTYQILKHGARATLPGGFVQLGQEFAKGNVMGNARQTGGPQAFVRKGKARYPLRAPKGPSVAAIWQNPANQIAADVLKDLNKRLPERIQGQAQRIYDRKWKKVSR